MKKVFVATAMALFLASQGFAGFAFTGISESSATDPTPLYGDPDILTFPGSSLVVADFNPGVAPANPFAADQNGIGSDTTDGQLNFTILADGGDFIRNVQFRESGSITIANGGSVLYGLTIVPTVRAINGVSTLQQLTPMVAQGSQAADGISAWTIDLELNLSDFGLANVTEIDFAVDNTLLATGSTAISTAFVDKKDFTVAVPEPSAFFFLGMVATGAIVWQKRRSSVVETEEDV